MERQAPISSPVFAFSRRARRVFCGSLAGAALLAAGLGCTGWSAESCDQYLLCVSATTPLAQSEQLALYGKDGSCWKQIEPEQCARACKAGLRALAMTSAAKECHPATSNPDDDVVGPGDPPVMPFSWPLPSKMAFYSGPTEDPLLTGEDPSGDWRCTRDDKNPTPSSEVQRMREPNDVPDQAIVLQSPLPVDPFPGSGQSSYEICPDRAAPTLSDFDTFQFRLSTQARIIAEVKYQVKYGDLDVSLFREDGTPNARKPVLVAAHLTGKDDACIERELSPGTYYLLVYGARDPVMQTKTAMNRYQLRVFEVQTSGYTCQ